MVGLSRISPIMMVRRLAQRVLQRDVEVLGVGADSSRWFTIDSFWKMNSTGSSSVMMWPVLRSLR